MGNEWRDVVLPSSGVVLRVRPLPSQFIIEKVVSRYPLPTPPIVEVKSGIPNVASTWVAQPDDARYQEERTAALMKRVQAVQDMQWLYCVDVPKPPSGWKEALGLDLVLEPSEFRDRVGGEKLDYLEFALLITPEDIRAVTDVINANRAPSPQEVEAVEEAFRN